MGISLNQTSGHYGLPLILGGAESSLWDMTNAYAGLAKTLNFFNSSSSEYPNDAFKEAVLESPNKASFTQKQQNAPVLGAGAIFNVLEALQKVNRPRGQENWQFFNESQPMAWKTGTSFGFKDAWAIGVTPKYAIGVWAGNADGEGRPGLTGIQAAAPLLFDVLERLPKSGWFNIPYDDLVEAPTCSKSGFLAGPHCERTHLEWVVAKGLRTPTCPYHQTLLLDADQSHQVTASCYPIERITPKSWFSLPPILGHYYAKNQPDYLEKPPFLSGCEAEELQLMQFIFPHQNETILLPKELGGGLGEVVFKLAHQKPENEVFWYLDNQFLGSTQQFHELALTPEPGTYVLSVMDALGNRMSQNISIERASD